MPEVLPRYSPGDAISQAISASVTGGQVVIFTGDRTVAPSTAATAAVAGVALYDVPFVAGSAANNVNVCNDGVFYLTAAAAVTAGQKVVAAVNGQVAPYAAATPPTPEVIIGTAMAGSAAGGQALIELNL